MLRALTRDAGYRVGAVAEETLWRVAEDPKIDAETRIGAALALRDELDGVGRARLRGVLEASASPRVRIALAAIATEGIDDGELREAVETCEASEGRRGRAIPDV